MLRPLHRLGRARSAAPAETRARFDAFISYSRANDAPLAVALQAALQRFTKPWYRLRVLHVFRDDASLSANPGLWSSIEQALQASRFLVLIASEDAARSNWVNAEVGWWCAHKSVERLLLVLANGEAMWDGPRRDFVWQANTALPAALRGVFQEEPRYVDLRFARTPDQFAANEPRFRDAVADLAAPIHGRPKDEMIGEDVRQHRRTLRTARAAGGILTVLALGAATAAFLAVRARDEARRETRLATAREVAAQSDLAARDGRLDLALLLAARSWLTDRTSEGRDALLAALNAATQLVAVRHTAPLSAVAASADGRMLALLGENGRVRLWDGLRRRPLDARLPAGTDPDSIAVGSSGRLLAFGHEGYVDLWDRGSRRHTVLRFTRPGQRRLPFDRVESVAFGHRSLEVAWAGEGRYVAVRRHGRTTILTTSIDPDERPWELAIAADGRTVAAATPFERVVVLWHLRPPPERSAAHVVNVGSTSGIPLSFDDTVASIAFSPTNPHLLAVGRDDAVRLLDTRRDREVGALRSRTGLVSSLAFTADGRRLAAAGAQGTAVWDVRRRRLVDSFATYGSDLGAFFLADGRTLVSFGRSGTIVLRDTLRRRSQLVHPLAPLLARTSDIAFSSDGRTLAALTGKHVQLWDVPKRRRLGQALIALRPIQQISFSPDGRSLVLWSDAGYEIWDVASRSRQRRSPQGVDGPDAIAFRGGDVFGAFSDVVANGQLRVANLTRLRQRPVRIPVSESAGSPELSDDGRYLAAWDEGIFVWDARTGRKVAGPIHADSEGWQFAPRDRLITQSEAGGAVRVWDARTGRPLPPAMPTPQSVLASVSFAADGRTLAATVDRLFIGTIPQVTSLSVRLFDLDKRRPLGAHPIVSGLPIYSDVHPVLSPDGRLLAFRTRDRRALPVLWDLDVDHWRRLACRLAGRDLTREEWQRLVSSTRPYEPTCG